MEKNGSGVPLNLLSPKFARRYNGEPVVPDVKGVDEAPYQAWAKLHLGFQFHNPSILITALTHRSYVNEHRGQARMHNERLEFLGDAVLELVTTDFLFKNYDMPEGTLTAWRSALVRTESIRDAGERLNYGSLVRMSKGERMGSDQAKLHIVANCFEALAGAIFLDQGYEAASKFIHKNILDHFDEILRDGSWRDPKSYLQEISQQIDNKTPSYKLLEEIGPDHDKTFTVAVYIDGREAGRGVGSSKQHAQQIAAQRAIKGIELAVSRGADTSNVLDIFGDPPETEAPASTGDADNLL